MVLTTESHIHSQNEVYRKVSEFWPYFHLTNTAKNKSILPIPILSEHLCYLGSKTLLNLMMYVCDLIQIRKHGTKKLV